MKRQYMPAAEGVGLLAIDLGEDAVHEQREIVSDTLRRDFGGGGAEWEDDGHALFTLEPDQLPAGETAADNVLHAAIAVLELLSPAPVTIACDVLGGDASDAERWLLPRRLRERAGDEKHRGAIVITHSVASCRAARKVPLEPVRGTIEALFEVEFGARARVAPLGRWVAPFHGALLAEDAPLNSPIEDGLLLPERVSGAMDASELFLADTRLVVVVAPPWTGKTYLAQCLRDALRRAGTPCHLTSLEHREGGHASWPDASFLRASEERVWIVDALDEGLARDADLGNLERVGAPTGLRTIVLSRADLQVSGFLDGLDASRQTFELLPLDREGVLNEVCVGESERLDAVLGAARGMVRALSFAEWEELDRVQREAVLREGCDRRALHDAVLRRRCETLRRGRVREKGLPSGMLEAAQWLAAFAAAIGQPRFTIGGGGVDVLRVVPDEHREAVQALRDTVVLARTGGREGDEWSFAAAHLIEDLAASFFATDGRLERIGEQRLRRLFTDGVGPLLDLRRVIERIDELTEGDLTRRLVPGPGDARRMLDALFEVAREVGHDIIWMVGRAELERLGHALTPDYARERLSEPKAGLASRHLALELAKAAGWTDLVADAVAIALDEGEDVALRRAAVSVAFLEPSAFSDLERVLHQVDRDTDDEELARFRSTILHNILVQGHLTPVDAIPLASAPEEHHVDARSLVVYALREALDLPAARLLIDDVRSGEPSRIAPRVRAELAPVAARVLLDTPSLVAEQDLERAAFIAQAPEAFYGWRDGSPHEALERLMKRDTTVRRELYARLVFAGAKTHLWLEPEDVAWLIERAAELSERPEKVQRDLHYAVRYLRQSGQEPLAARGESLLRTDGVWEAFERQREATRRSLAEWEAKNAAWRKEREEAVARTLHLSDLVPRLLGDDREASVRLHVLGDVVFGGRLAARNVIGSFDDLADETKDALIRAARSALEEATPGEIPRSTNRFSSTLLDEAAAFRAVATWTREDGWLDAHLVRSWLPAALFAETGASSDLVDVIERCHEVAPEPTVAALVDSFGQQAQRGYAHVHLVPERVRQDSQMASALEALVRQLAAEPPEEDKSGGFRELLGLYLDVRPPSGRSRSLFETLVGAAEPHVARTAAAAWLARRPAEGHGAAIRLMVDEASAAAVLGSIADHTYRQRYSLQEWPSEALAEVALRLAETVRPEDDPPEVRGAHVITTRETLQELREALIAQCFEREDEAAVVAALERIRGLWPRYDARVRWRERAVQARGALDDFRQLRLSAGEAAEQLKAGYRVLRDEADVAMTIKEVLDEEWDPTWHMLLFDRDAARRHERAAQALVHLVLTERLADATRPAVTLTVREPLNRGSDEPDFEVHAVRAGERFSVPIEVKWDNHREWKTALRSQLAERYCRGCRHGVYVVVTADRDPVDLETQLVEQAAAVGRALGITIRVVVKDVREGRPKPRTSGATRSRKTRR